MKKIFVCAAVAMIALSFTACKEGSCGCIGKQSDGSRLAGWAQAAGYSDGEVCDQILANYPNYKKDSTFCQKGMSKAEFDTLQYGSGKVSYEVTVE